MKIFRISQTDRDGYDTYDSAVVCCADKESASLIHPRGYYDWTDGKWIATRADGSTHEEGNYGSWARNPELVNVEYIGEASSQITASGVICASFNAG